MARIPKETVDQIIHHADIVEVVGDFVSLKRKGQNMWACCPFHHEKSPSFSVAPAKGLYKCFGCGKAGGVVQFIMDIEGTSYVEALKYLAKKYGIDVEEEEKTPEEQLAQNEKDSQFIVSNWAKDHYHSLLLNTDEGQSIGLSYLRQRGLNQATIKTFELGYSLDQWDDLLKTAEKQGHQRKYLEKTGLIITREDEQGKDTGRRYDRFRGRVMFPIHNVSGRVIGFGARTLKPNDKTAKYLNSPESEIYHKSDVLYGLYQARQAIRTEELCYLVEGYLDVLSLHQGDIKNVVASSGTSLTDGQIRLIKRYTDNVTVLYDGDAAGIRASLRGIDMLLEGGLNVRVVLFPDGDDPDSYIRKVGDQRFKDHLENASQDFIQFKTDLVAREAAQDPVKKAEAIRDVLQSIGKVPDPIKRQVFLQQTSHAFGIDEQVLITEYNKLVRNATGKAAGGNPSSTGSAGGGSSAAAGPGTAAPRPAPRPMSPEEEAEALMYGASPEDLAGNGGDTFLAPKEDLEPVPDVQESCEREVVRLLLLYSPQPLAPEVSVAQYLLQQLDDTPFKTGIYGDLLHLCREELEQGRWPEVRTLIQHGRSDIRALVAELATEKYELSPNWTTHQIYVPRELDQLQIACDNAILRLNKVNVERELAVRLEALRHPLDDDTMMEHLQTIRLLKQMDNQLASMLGTVIPRGA
ncbi:DNA primase [Hymenobacter taeanensis]|uniref:DNA primase n=1 Tax=Hymenobacter taeanensis TaxID=2735321 RepID=A0A6M6BKT5_9BACT|nr:MULTISPECIES: DNA primase [Hymenobacter]QJX48468.1 DNA primase [Hymenobacter taeanensis]UOQ82037.1 DNA primase [Hymenobacter sp. 5414T-23]